MALKQYIAIDLKSFYASVECAARSLNPLDANLVVADTERTEKTICLAVTPALKKYGISGRARLFEVIEAVKQINAERLMHAPGKKFTGKSYLASELSAHPEYELDYLIAVPRMGEYIEYSTDIVDIYLKYIAPEDMHVYSIDEVFMDVTSYLNTYKMTAKKLCSTMIKEVFDKTSITATGGIGTNLFLCKVALDMLAKHADPDENGVRIAELDEMSYRRKLWTHKPITDFWRIGAGTAARLEKLGIYTMGDIARCSLGKATDFHNEALLYKTFGINAELIIDHAWGLEPCTMEEIHTYKPESNSITSGQVLKTPYSFEQGKTVIREMAEGLSLELTAKKKVSDIFVIHISYDIENFKDPEKMKNYRGEIKKDFYGRGLVPKAAHGTCRLPEKTHSSRIISEAIVKLYNEIVNPYFTVRRLNVSAGDIVSDENTGKEKKAVQLDLFSDFDKQVEDSIKHIKETEKENRLQNAMLDIKTRFGVNAVLKGTDFMEGATAIERNSQIGGHRK